jgi:hypothetical protein
MTCARKLASDFALNVVAEMSLATQSREADYSRGGHVRDVEESATRTCFCIQLRRALWIIEECPSAYSMRLEARSRFNAPAGRQRLDSSHFGKLRTTRALLIKDHMAPLHMPAD